MVYFKEFVRMYLKYHIIYATIKAPKSTTVQERQDSSVKPGMEAKRSFAEMRTCSE
jgi:hypothetical protein